jgi:hypothetical protein
LMLPSEEYENSLGPPTAAVVNLSLPNTTRQLISDQLYTVNLGLGQDPSMARVNADARALQMVP